MLNQEDRAVFLRNKIVTFVQKKNLGSVAALKTVGLMLGIEDPWQRLAQHLQRERKELRRWCRLRLTAETTSSIRRTETWRPNLEKQPIAFAWTQQAVDTIKHVCLGFDELVAIRMAQHRADLAARQETAHV